MSRARLSGPPAVEPVYAYIDDFRDVTTAPRGSGAHYPEQEPVSPLSPQSIAILTQRQNSVKRVSPITSPIRSRSTARRQQTPQRTQATAQSVPRESYPPARIRNCPPRKPVTGHTSPPQNGSVRVHNPVLVNQERHTSVRPEHVRPSRPRPQSFHALDPIPETYLQDFSDHTAAPAPPRPQRPRSITSPPPTTNTTHPLPNPRTTCSHCGKPQRSHPTQFISCPTCRGVFYCSTPCWDRRVCHRSVKCRICACTTASTDTMDFKRCVRCYMATNKDYWYCGDDCWERRNCHGREEDGGQGQTVATTPAAVPVRAMQQSHGAMRPMYPLPRQTEILYDRDLPENRDLEALRAEGKSVKPWSERTGVSAVVWAVGLALILLMIFIPVLIVKGHG
ncbi:hypothetical protein ACLMJK_007374 [Lecanora helva]